MYSTPGIWRTLGPLLKPAHPGRVTGLGDIPADWLPLPPNASLASEIQWVQASRIDVVEDLPSGAVVVHLDRADRPAPSKAAIGWLETSIRAFSKYCDIAAKATSRICVSKVTLLILWALLRDLSPSKA